MKGERREKAKTIKELKSEVSDLDTIVENELDRQEQYLWRNCIIIHGVTETQGENAWWYFPTHNKWTFRNRADRNELDRTNKNFNPKSGKKRPRHIIVKFVRYNTRREVFVNKKR